MRISDWSSDVCSSDLKALAGSQERTEKVAALQKAEWSLLGWEPPKYVAGKPRFKGAVRGQVWRDPYGKLSILPAADHIIPPSIDEDPGIILVIGRASCRERGGQLV